MLGNVYKRLIGRRQSSSLTSIDKADIHISNGDLIGAGIIVLGAMFIWDNLRKSNSQRPSLKSITALPFKKNQTKQNELQCNIVKHSILEQQLQQLKLEKTELEKELRKTNEYLESKLFEERLKSEELNDGLRNTINTKDSEIESLKKEMAQIIAENDEMISDFKNENEELNEKMESLQNSLEDETNVIKQSFERRISQVMLENERLSETVRRRSSVSVQSASGLRAKHLNLKLINHNGHLSRRFYGDCKPQNALNSKISSYYLSKNGSIKNDWIIFKIDHENLYYPTKVKIFSNGDKSAPNKIMFFIGNGKDNTCGDWMLLNEKPIEYQKDGDKQAFNFDISEKARNEIVSNKFNYIKINVMGNHGDKKFIQINQLQLYGVQL